MKIEDITGLDDIPLFDYYKCRIVVEPADRAWKERVCDVEEWAESINIPCMIRSTGIVYVRDRNDATIFALKWS